MGVRDQPLIRAIEAAALLHDMGKLAVPEYILNKPGPLTPAEFEKMKLHASVGADILSAIDFPYPVVPIVRHHHENWDGTGYPDRIGGPDIPIGARILAVVDCFDALTSDRPYRPRLSDKDAIRILIDRRGSMYDPLVVDAFLRVHESIAPSTQSPLGPAPLQAITAAANVPAVFAENRAARLEEIAASSDEMLTLFELAQSLTTHTNFPDVAELIAKHLRRLIPSSACVFFLYDIEQDDLRAEQVLGEHSALIKGLRVPIGQRLSGWVAANRQTVRNSDPVLDLGESARAMSPRPRSCLSTPLVSGSSLVGVLSLYSSNRDAYSEDHQRIIEVVARQVSSVISEVHEAQQARSTTVRDQRTGLPNLRQLAEVVRRQLGMGGPTNSFCLVTIRYSARASESGATGKFQSLVDLLRKAMRPADLLFRTGPHELTILLLNTGRDAASSLCSKVESLVTAWEANTSVACSVGLSCAPLDGADVDVLLHMARQSMSDRPDRPSEPQGPIH
jgi:putative nucleotidyltransferase with HDIG domain